MTKKHIALLARAMVQARQDVWNSHSYDQWKACCACLAASLKVVNPKLDTDKFIEACSEDW